MRSRVRLLAGVVLFSALTLPASFAGSVYRWVDVSGTVNFSEEPPPLELATDYEEISGELRAMHIRVDKLPEENVDGTQAQERPTLPRPPASEARAESRDRRLNAEMAPQDELRKKSYCANLKKQIEKLEARLPHLSDTKQLDSLVLAIESYEESIATQCN